MHRNTFQLMKSFRASLPADLHGLKLLEVGSLDVNGSYRPLFPGIEYLGVDIVPGKCVDQVLEQPYSYPCPDNYFDVIISGQALEHMRHPWKAVPEMARVLKQGGKICLIAPWKWSIHRYPIDCWRILPDGMRQLLEDAGLEIQHCTFSNNDTIGIATKAARQT